MKILFILLKSCLQNKLQNHEIISISAKKKKKTFDKTQYKIRVLKNGRKVV